MNRAVPLLQVDSLSVRYALPPSTLLGKSRVLDALTDVSIAVGAGEAMGVVGESGSGKSTLARAILGLVRPRAGRVLWDGREIDYANRQAVRALRRELQVVFQDPFGSLDPRMTAGAVVAEALDALEGEGDPTRARARIAATFEDVGLSPALADRYPHELSGGQCQRVAIARATITRPRLLVCDEATSALDVSVQAQIVNLLRELRLRHRMALLFISHNLGVVHQLCDRVAVLRRGKLVEQGTRAEIFESPRHAYTRELLAAVPEPDPSRHPRRGASLGPASA